MEVKEIKIEEIILSESNTRKDLVAGTEDSSIEDLAQSIKEKGLLNPITVRVNKAGFYELIAGQRRFLACQKLGWKTIPAIVRDVTDDTDATILSLIENVHRADMNPLDKARAYRKIFEKYRDLNRTAKETGVSIATIKKYLKLLELAPSIQQRISTSDGPAGIETLAKIAETFPPEVQEMVLEKIGGFKQQIQLEMIKRAEGDWSKLSELREQALEGAFDTVICKGLEDCPFIPKEMVSPVKEAIANYKNTGKVSSFKEIVRKLIRW